ncbi:hypothetical protein B0H13DRAFT_1869560 [Mycena leptocephala]|nr:hypothetical protein B0H13DRAFT_1869560 [Mycena leptocephala]
MLTADADSTPSVSKQKAQAQRYCLPHRESHNVALLQQSSCIECEEAQKGRGIEQLAWNWPSQACRKKTPNAILVSRCDVAVDSDTTDDLAESSGSSTLLVALGRGTIETVFGEGNETGVLQRESEAKWLSKFAEDSEEMYNISAGDSGWERWDALNSSATVYRILNVGDSGNDSEDEDEDDYEEPDEGSSSKMRRPKAPSLAFRKAESSSFQPKQWQMNPGTACRVLQQISKLGCLEPFQGGFCWCPSGVIASEISISVAVGGFMIQGWNISEVLFTREAVPAKTVWKQLSRINHIPRVTIPPHRPRHTYNSDKRAYLAHFWAVFLDFLYGTLGMMSYTYCKRPFGPKSSADNL